MFIIIEWNGHPSTGFMGAVLNKQGHVRFWYTDAQARKWAEKNCAFRYKIVEL